MATLRSVSRVTAPVEEAFAFFDDPANLAKLAPPPGWMRLVSVDPAPPQAGSIIELRYGIGPYERRWVIRLLEHVRDARIVDETVSGPMRRFRHSHTFRAASRGGTWIEDRIEFQVGPGGPIGAVIDLAASLVLRGVFLWRAARQRRLLRRR